MSFAEVVRELLEEQYPRVQDTKIIVMSSIVLRILPPATGPLFLRYGNLETLVLTKCDLRNLENFPKLLTLRQLDLSDNSLQGSLNYLMPLANLKYLGLANNLIADCRKLQPLQVIDGLEVFMGGNPFLEGDAWRNKVRSYGLKVAKEGRTWETQRVKQEEKKEERKQQDKEQPISVTVVPKGEADDAPRRSLFLQMRARRQRSLEQQALARRPKMPELESDSLSMLEILGDDGEIGHMIDNYGQESEDLQDDSDNDDSENEKKDEGEEEDEQEEELLYNQGFAPLLDAFDADDLQGQDEEPQEEDSDD